MTQDIQSHTFANGLVLVAEPMKSVESAAFTIRVPAGCVYEPANLGGLAGIACDMTTRGAGPRDSREFVTALDNLGVQRGESIHDSHASFGGAMLAKNLFATLEICADVLLRPHLPADQLEASRLAAMQELGAVEDEPSQKVMLELRRRFFADPWGRPSQGSRAGIESVTHDDVRAFLARGFRPNGAILGVAGRIDWPALRDHVGTLLADWRPVDLTEPPEGTLGVPYAHVPHDSSQTQIAIAYPSVPYRHENYYRASGAVSVLSGGMSSRLFTEVRERRGLCYSVYAAHTSLRERGCVVCYAGTSAERAQETLDVTLGEVHRLARGIEQNELDRLKARVKSGLIMQQESSSARSASLVRDWYFLGRVRTLDEVGRKVDELSRDGINAYLADHPPRDFTIVTLGPQPLEVRLGVS